MAKRELSSILRNLKVYAKSNLERGEERRCQTIPYHLRFPFYEPGFGWGKPPWATSGTEFKNLIVLMDTRDGDGIEVSLNLKEEDLAIYESTKELLELEDFYFHQVYLQLQALKYNVVLGCHLDSQSHVSTAVSKRSLRRSDAVLSSHYYNKHGELYKALCAIYCKIMSVIPSLNTTQTGSKSGIQA